MAGTLCQHARCFGDLRSFNPPTLHAAHASRCFRSHPAFREHDLRSCLVTPSNPRRVPRSLFAVCFIASFDFVPWFVHVLNLHAYALAGYHCVSVTWGLSDRVAFRFTFAHRPFVAFCNQVVRVVLDLATLAVLPRVLLPSHR